MPSDSRYDPLFEPVGIRPLTAKSRLYQVPQATRMGYAMPQTRRNARGEGGMQLGRGVHGILLRPPKLREFVIRLRNPVRPGRCQGAGSDGRGCASAWRPRGNRTLACGPPFAKPDESREAAVAVRAAVVLPASSSEPRNGPGGYPEPPPLAGRCGGSETAKLRPRSSTPCIPGTATLGSRTRRRLTKCRSSASGS